MRRPIVFVLLAGFAALVAAIVVYSALKRREAEVEQAMVRSVQIVVAARDIEIGSKLDPSSVKLVRWSRDDIPAGAFTDPAAVMNQYTKTGFVQGEPIIGDRLFNGDKNAGVLPLLIPSGMRAVSVPVDEISDIAGFVLPHARVDVLVSVTNNANGGSQPFSKIVLQNVEVLAVAQEIESVQDKPEVVKVITFLVTPEQAERLTLASREGALRLALRNYDDKKIVMTSGVDISQLLRAYGGPEPAMPLIAPQHVAGVGRRAARVQPVQVEVLRNGRSTENISFVKTGGSAARAKPRLEGETSSAAEHSTKYASAAPDAAVAEAIDPPPSAHAKTPAPVAMAERGSHPAGAVAAMPVMMNPGSESFSAPRSKTIDVPWVKGRMGEEQR
jgi:pilus assembly protein CpaB